MSGSLHTSLELKSIKTMKEMHIIALGAATLLVENLLTINYVKLKGTVLQDG